ncbi:MAG: hypothetical protein KF828_00135 [Anaerolineales bacterium]|nr:hypothetical protein [Anaerolineales bacterium]
MRNPDFYLSSSEGYNLSLPRKCYVVRKVESEYSMNLLLIDVEPPVDVSKYYGPHFSCLRRLLLAPRHRGDSLETLNNLPISVFVIVVTENTQDLEFIKLQYQQLIAWGEIYSSYEDALDRTKNGLAEP